MFSPQGPVSFTAQGRQHKLNKQHFSISFLLGVCPAAFTVGFLISCAPFCFLGSCAPSHILLPSWCSSPEPLLRCNTKSCCAFPSVSPRHPVTFVSAPFHLLQLLSESCCCLQRVPLLSPHPHSLGHWGLGSHMILTHPIPINPRGRTKESALHPGAVTQRGALQRVFMPAWD